MSDNNQGSHPERMAPHSVEAEEAVLGSILINPDALLEVKSFLVADDFFIVRHAWIWEAILAIDERSEAIDTISVVEELHRQSRLDSIGGPAYITDLINNTPSHVNAETYGHIVERAAVRRRLLKAAQDIARTAIEENVELEDVVNRAELTLFSVTQRQLKKEMIPLNQAAHEYFDRIEDLYNKRDEPLGVASGFTDLDKLLGGLQKSDLIVVAARPGVGKTSFMLSIALNAARASSARVAIFSLEMSQEQLVQRFYSADTGINSQKLRLGNLDEDEWRRFVEATGKLDRLRIFIDDTPAVTVNQMRAKCRRLYREEGLDLIIVDYLQLISSGSHNENRVQEISYISRGLKELARELNVPVLTAAQLSRAVEQRGDKRPILSDLRESGCLAGDTLIYLPDRGSHIEIRELVDQRNFSVYSLDTKASSFHEGLVTNAFCTGIKPIYHLTTASGHSVRATANHKFLTVNGWTRLDKLTKNDRLATSNTLLATVIGDVYWDSIASIEADGETDVYDLTVPEFSNFVANNIIVHNSIEQDADIVMFLYREEMYDEASERQNQADVIVSKHRNGPTGVITLYFKKELTQFMNMSKRTSDLTNY